MTGGDGAARAPQAGVQGAPRRRPRASRRSSSRPSIGALREFPRLNAEIQGDEMVLKHYYDIGVAVGADGRAGRAGAARRRPHVVRRDRDADPRVRRRRRRRHAVARRSQGGTFTITNGGVFGSLLSTPILNPPQVGILGLHAIKERPVARQRPGRDPADDVHRAHLRSPHRRRLARRCSSSCASRSWSRIRARCCSNRADRFTAAMSEADRLVDQFKRAHDGDPWHGSPVKADSRGRDGEAGGDQAPQRRALHLGARAPPHRAGATKSRTARPASPRGRRPPATGRRSASRRRRGGRRRSPRSTPRTQHMVKVARELSDDRLLEPTNDPRNRPLGTGVSYYELLHGAVQHDAYHAGQIAILKKVLGFEGSTVRRFDPMSADKPDGERTQGHRLRRAVVVRRGDAILFAVGHRQRTARRSPVPLRSRPALRAVPDRPPARERGHGPGLRSGGNRKRTADRDEDPEPRARRRRGARAVSARGAAGRLAQPSEHASTSSARPRSRAFR